MKATVHNNSKALQGVRTAAGRVVFIRPGHQRTLDIQEDDVEATRRLPFLRLEEHEAPAPKGPQRARVFVAVADDTEGAGLELVDLRGKGFVGIAVAAEGEAPSHAGEYNWHPREFDPEEAYPLGRSTVPLVPADTLVGDLGNDLIGGENGEDFLTGKDGDSTNDDFLFGDNDDENGNDFLEPTEDNGNDGLNGDPAPPRPNADQAPDFNAMDDDALRAFLTERDGQAPHPNTGRPKLLAKARGE